MDERAHIVDEARLAPDELKTALRQFHGTETFFQIYDTIRITEGVFFLCEHAQSYWLIDAIWSYQTLTRVRKEGFQVIDLTVNLAEKTGLIMVGDGNDHEIHRQEVPYTDFPLSQLRLYYTDHTVLLPQEY